MLEIIIGKSDKDWIIVGNFFYILIFAFVLLLIEVCKHHEVRQCNLLSMCIARGPTTSRLKCVFHHQVSILEHHKKYVMLLLNIESIVCMTAVDCLEEIVSCLKSLSSLLLNKFYSCFFLVYEKKYFSTQNPGEGTRISEKKFAVAFRQGFESKNSFAIFKKVI